MTDSLIDREMRALTALQAVIADAKRARQLFEDAGLEVPAPLIRLFGSSAGQQRNTAPLQIPPLDVPKRPVEAAQDWIWVPLNKCVPMTLVKAFLRANNGPLNPKAIVREVKELLPDATVGGIYNVCPRLEKSKVIERTDDGWKLVKSEEAPVILDGYAWGPVEVFQSYEHTFRRREIILHILRHSQGGLQIVQLVNQMRAFGYYKGTVNKDLVKGDIETLRAEKQIKRIGGSRKWKAITEREDE
ncbi:MAG: hypothetical protein K8T25_18730 [Planctomycetia bacterium]|nr:hypothetical protein [Planctomycetia bacterium]